jgi:hypothetical protein
VNGDEFKAARQALGLSASRMARVFMELGDPGREEVIARRIRRWSKTTTVAVPGEAIAFITLLARVSGSISMLAHLIPPPKKKVELSEGKPSKRGSNGFKKAGTPTSADLQEPTV